MTRVNERIRSPEVRVIYGEHNLVLPTYKALAKAKELGLDLVEIAPNVRPPVCRIVEFGKWKYDQSKLNKNQKPKNREKEVKFRVNIDPHDYSIKMTRAEDFLCAGHKVRMQLQFRGRQMAHKDLGFALMERVKEDLSGVCQVDLEPKLNARNILMMVSPLAENKRVRKYRTDEEEVDIDEIEEAEAAEDDHDDLNPEDQYDEEGELIEGEKADGEDTDDIGDADTDGDADPDTEAASDKDDKGEKE
ncbi:translation initiation factor IF-3 [Verrucomicrobiales bacterium]|nr:translation initiation factor IF-3 [Verrucomicrobiales bacterium]